MKAALSLLAAIIGFELTSSVVGQQINCANIPPPGPKVCLGSKDVCTTNVTGCCDGLTCSGFSFYKRCVTPPVCLEEWHDCTTPDGYCIQCCPPYVCGQMPSGNWACQPDDIGVKKCPIPGSNVKSTPAPTPSPSPAKNTNTTTVPGANVTHGTSCCVGDPHCYTFDGLKFDCQSEGEHVLLKSKTTQRQINGLYKHYASNVAISVTKGVVIQDEGDTPRVQIYIPDLQSTPANLIDKSDNCSVLLFIDGAQKNLFDPTLANSTKVKITISGTTITVLYPVSQFYVTVGVSYWNTCLLAVCAFVPTVDHVYGIMGTNNGNTADDWTLPNGTSLPVPTTYVNRLMQPGFAFCNNYCVRNQSDSLFVYPEKGCDFTYFDHCALPYGTTLDQIMKNLSQAILNVCGDDVDCLMDGVVGGLAAAQDTMVRRLPIQATCNNAGGECSTATCCAGLTCINTGRNGKFCGTPPTCAVEMADCSSSSCCANLTCVTDNFNKKSCQSNTCKAEWINCNTDADCCSKLTCVDNLKGGKQCRLLPTCMPELDDCSHIGCCAGLSCVTTKFGSKQCQQKPACNENEWDNCDTIPCCDGLTCIVDDDDRNICAALPECEDVGGSCASVGCCAQDNVICADVVDSKGRAGKQCKLKSVDLKVRVFDDCDGDGQSDVGENGLTALAVRLVTADFGTQLADQGDGGCAHLDLRTDTDGYVTFTKVPRGLSLAVMIVQPPGGAIPTIFQKPGVDDDKCSHLKSNQLSDVFNFDSNTPVQTTKSLGYLMPNDASVTVFNDANGNGIMDATEKIVPGIGVRLIRDADGQYLPDQQNGGCAHEEVPVDSKGCSKFTKVPQGVDLRFNITNLPAGAVVTKPPPKFNLQSGACAVFNSTYIPLSVPETVQVRVWDDSNSNGIQDSSEHGIQGVKLRLITDSNRQYLPDQGNGGTAGLELTTDVNGLVSFVKVPVGVALRVLVTRAPVGGLPSPKGVGTNPEANSDLNTDGTSDAFTLTGKEAGGLFTSTDLGYRMPNSVQVRVYKDDNCNGIQDAGEIGISKAWFMLIKDADNSTLTDQKNGGNCHRQVQTDDDGYVTFTQVPLGLALRVRHIFEVPAVAKTTEAFKLDGSVAVYTPKSLGYCMPHNLTVKVFDDADCDGIQDVGELGVANVKFRLITDVDKKFVTNFNNGGNAHLELATGADGTCTFTNVPHGVTFRAKVTGGPCGSVRSTPNKIPSVEPSAACGIQALKTYGSVNVGDIGHYTTNPIQITHVSASNQVTFKVKQNWKDRCSVNSISTYYTGSDGIVRCPMQANVADETSEFISKCDARTGLATVQVFVSDSSYQGLPAVTIPSLCQLPADGTKTAFNFTIPCTCPMLDTFNATYTRDDIDRNLRDDGTTDSFDLGNFVGGIFGATQVGFCMPHDVNVRVWDDQDGDGYQDVNENGVKNVTVVLVTAADGKQLVNQNNGGDCHLPHTTDANGYLTFTKVPKGVDVRMKVVNQPGGAAPTTRLCDDSLAANTTDLRSQGLTDIFNLNKFSNKTFGNISLGYQMPADVAIHLYDDHNGNGVQDAGEPDIPNVQLKIVQASDGSDLTNIGGGSTCHLVGTSNASGVCKFSKCPKDRDLQFQVLNAPKGSNPTQAVNSSGVSSSFHLCSFAGATGFSTQSCGYKVQKSVVIRVWNDTNKNGIQEDGEPGMNNCTVKLMLGNGTAFPNLNNGGNAHLPLTTDGNGRVTFINCPTGLDIKAVVTSGLPSTAKPCPKKVGTNDQLDSHANPDWTTDSFQVTSTTDDIYDHVDFGCM